MTNEEAIFIIRDLMKGCLKSFLADPDVEAFEMAIKALKSQSEAENYRTPQKVPIDSRIGRYGRCPLCGEICNKTDNFCTNCGQNLDWN